MPNAASIQAAINEKVLQLKQMGMGEIEAIKAAYRMFAPKKDILLPNKLAQPGASISAGDVELPRTGYMDERIPHDPNDPMQMSLMDKRFQIEKDLAGR